MNLQQIIVTVITSSTITGLIIAAITYLAKSLLSTWLSKDIEKFKADLVREKDKEIERLKAEISLKSFISQKRFSNIYEKRASILAELYAKMLNAHSSISQFLSPFRFEGQPDNKELATTAYNSLREFTNYYLVNALYFEKDLIEKLNAFVDRVQQLMLKFQIEAKKDPTIWSKVFNEFIEEVPSLKEEIERDFRKMLGVE